MHLKASRSLPAAHRPSRSPPSLRLLSPRGAGGALASVDMSDALSLQNIRSSLIRQEDTIIFGMIERAQFARNDAVYTPSDAIAVPGETLIDVVAWLHGLRMGSTIYPCRPVHLL